MDVAVRYIAVALLALLLLIVVYLLVGMIVEEWRERKGRLQRERQAMQEVAKARAAYLQAEQEFAAAIREYHDQSSILN